jgi:NAD(P)-dependent dehydrogenase (short-subunit alcohol dehydrogenase family)
MKSVFIIGGYGGFGARLSRRLSKAGWQVLVAGRRLEAAIAFCADIENGLPMRADRTKDLGPLLREHKPDLVIDAAGPFQGNNYRVPLACIGAGVHYLDLADARIFVANISNLDEQAKAAGVCVISGASSVPALSGAVVADLAKSFTRVTAINMAISASNRATAGPSVAASIMSYVGKPLQIWNGGKWSTKTGWHMLRREHFEVEGRKGFHRLTALSDVPDHSILPRALPDRPATSFRAGPEFSFQVLSIWALSWLVRWGVIPSLAALSGWLRFLQAPTNKLGSDRSGMVVEVKGFDGAVGQVARWTLIAENGDGREIPTLAAALLAQKIVAGEMEPGAHAANNLLTLADFKPQFDRLAIYSGRTQMPYTPLYARVLGPKFADLPPAVRDLHTLVGNSGAAGEALVTRGPSFFAGVISAIVGFPRAGTHPLHVSFDEHEGVEHWTREFGATKFSSHLRQDGTYLIERFGPLAFRLLVKGSSEGLTMAVQSWKAFGIPLPRWLGPTTQAREWQNGDVFCFDVAINLPLIGNVVRYQGRLLPL